MDSKNNMAFTLANMMQNATLFINQIENAEGLNLNEDQKKEFKQKIKDAGGDKVIVDLKNKLQEFKDNLQKHANHKV